MKKLEVYDPAMCCSTGVCGLEADPVLVTFAADLKWAAEQGVEVAGITSARSPRLLPRIPRSQGNASRASTGFRSSPLTVISSRPAPTCRGAVGGKTRSATAGKSRALAVRPAAHPKSGCC